MKNEIALKGREVSTDTSDCRDHKERTWQSKKLDLEVDGWEPSLLHRLLKYLDPKTK